MAIEAAVQAIVPALNSCYKEALARTPNLRGRLTLTMTVTPQRGADRGRIENAELDSRRVHAPLFRLCMLNALASAQIPQPSQEIYVNYPFTLNPGMQQRTITTSSSLEVISDDSESTAYSFVDDEAAEDDDENDDDDSDQVDQDS